MPALFPLCIAMADHFCRCRFERISSSLHRLVSVILSIKRLRISYKTHIATMKTTQPPSEMRWIHELFWINQFVFGSVESILDNLFSLIQPNQFIQDPFYWIYSVKCFRLDRFSLERNYIKKSMKSTVSWVQLTRLGSDMKSVKFSDERIGISIKSNFFGENLSSTLEW